MFCVIEYLEAIENLTNRAATKKGCFYSHFRILPKGFCSRGRQNSTVAKPTCFMRNLLLMLCFIPALICESQTPYYDQTREGFIVFHPVRLDSSSKLLPWYSEDASMAYDFVINAVWNFWDTMRKDLNGLPYYMNHQVWRPINDPRGIGGDQFAMALSSWQLLYQYSGNEKVKENMKFIADYYLTHSMSPSHAKWPNIPYPYNMMQYSGFYDGDMVIGKEYTQPDKAGSFGSELIKLFKITRNEMYLEHAINIANTLSMHTVAGDYDQSPLPFKVHTMSGKVGQLRSNSGSSAVEGQSSYTTNWAGTLELFLALQQMKKGLPAQYKVAFDRILNWMKKFPLKNNRWGPFFEDIPGWSDTQINAVTFARFMMEHQELFPDWKKQVRAILDWVYQRLGNDQWEKYGVKAVNEQTAYQTPGNSHTARQAAAELFYSSLTGDSSRKGLAIRQLNWATYMVDTDRKNNYPRDEVWLTDGYGDYIRHYLRSMAVCPDLAPNQTHILSSTSIVIQADYPPNFNKKLGLDIPTAELDKVAVFYKTYDPSATEIIRLTAKPSRVVEGGKALAEVPLNSNLAGWQWSNLGRGGLLRIRHAKNTITVYK